MTTIDTNKRLSTFLRKTEQDNHKFQYFVETNVPRNKIAQGKKETCTIQKEIKITEFMDEKIFGIFNPNSGLRSTKVIFHVGIPGGYKAIYSLIEATNDTQDKSKLLGKQDKVINQNKPELELNQAEGFGSGTSNNFDPIKSVKIEVTCIHEMNNGDIKIIKETKLPSIITKKQVPHSSH